MKNNLYFDKLTHKVRIVAPASAVSSIKEVNDKALIRILELFKQNGIIATANPDICNPPRLPYYSNNLEFRVKDFKDALMDDEVRIIWMFRGGYGSAELIDYLDVTPKTPKILVGFSDVTALLFFFIQNYNLPVIHGGRIIDSDNNDLGQIEAIINLINISQTSYSIEAYNDIKNNNIEGKIVGGNLKIITTLIGTQIHPDTHDKILIIEDVNEKGYAIMRDLIHLKQAGLLKSVKAIIFGDFIGGDELNGNNFVEDTIKDFSKRLDIPCFKIKDFGHGKINHPMILNANCVIERNILKILNPFKI